MNEETRKFLSRNRGDDFKFQYMMLDRLKMDCDYYLGNGNRNKNILWSKDELEQIEIMKMLWNLVPEKPEWFTMEEIEQYEKEMIKVNTVSNELFEIMSKNLDVRTEYSGRCMDGEVCFGFVSYNIFWSIGELLFQINHDPYLVEEFGELIQDACTDNMGDRTIVYFPNFKVETEE